MRLRDTQEYRTLVKKAGELDTGLILFTADGDHYSTIEEAFENVIYGLTMVNVTTATQLALARELVDQIAEAEGSDEMKVFRTLSNMTNGEAED